MKNLLKIYIKKRLNDIEKSLSDDLISETERNFLEGQKDELLSIKRLLGLMGW